MDKHKICAKSSSYVNEKKWSIAVMLMFTAEVKLMKGQNRFYE